MNSAREMLIQQCTAARAAMLTLSSSKGGVRNKAISLMADKLQEDSAYIIAENAVDIENAKAKGIKESFIDRLMLNETRINAIANSLRKVAALDDPLGGGSVWTRPNGLEIKKVKVPLGLIAMIYEARPNVTADAAALCVKSGNACILRCGKEAIKSSLAIVKSIKKALSEAGLPEDCVQILSDTSRETATELMTLDGYVDLLIPRGGKSLIRSVVENATVPTIETGAGNCHLYVEKSADLKMALEIVYNAKVSRPSVCNAAETLLVDRAIAAEFLPLVKEKLDIVELRGCEETTAILGGIKAATEDDFFTEYDDYIMAVKVVDGLEEAVAHINKHNTKHSEAIVTSDLSKAERFTVAVDAAAVYVNASTRFTDGEEFGFGAEIGISTQKLHARGPMGLAELTTTKYIVHGNGQIR
ncbi:MAG: glutamate-5-semialdehyde dehydrogenase [Clostridia bacterium]|nr:glutamate-5-semialdehyde dehydrogenase [Clostridia bacterium]